MRKTVVTQLKINLPLGKVKELTKQEENKNRVLEKLQEFTKDSS